MKTVRFLETRTVQRNGGPTYEAGSVHQLRDDQARHWYSRGVIEYVSDSAFEPAALEEVQQSEFTESEEDDKPSDDETEPPK